jgi:hypothetical protein
LNKLIGEIAQRKTFQQALQFGRWLELRIPAEGCSPNAAAPIDAPLRYSACVKNTKEDVPIIMSDEERSSKIVAT